MDFRKSKQLKDMRAKIMLHTCPCMAIAISSFRTFVPSCLSALNLACISVQGVNQSLAEGPLKRTRARAHIRFKAHATALIPKHDSNCIIRSIFRHHSWQLNVFHEGWARITRTASTGSAVRCAAAGGCCVLGFTGPARLRGRQEVSCWLQRNKPPLTGSLTPTHPTACCQQPPCSW